MQYKLVAKDFIIFILAFTAVVNSQMAASVELRDPVALYQKKYLNTQAGVFEDKEWLFVIANISITSSKQPAMHYEGKAMLQTQALMKEYILNRADLKPLLAHGIKGTLGADINARIQQGRFYDFRLNDFSIRVIESRVIKNHRRRVSVFRADDLQGVLIRFSTEFDMQQLINQLLMTAERGENNALLAQYYFDLGLLRAAYFYKIQQLSQIYYLVNYPAPVKSPFKSRKLLRTILTTNPKDYELSWLKDLPANPELFDVIQQQLEPTDWLGKSVLALLLMPATANPDQFDKVIQALNHLSPDDIVKNELHFLEQNSAKLSSNEILADVLLTSLKNHGFLMMDESYNAESNPAFFQAKTLFSQGKSIDRVIELLCQSIKTSPRHVASWVYLGSALKYKKQYVAALAVFQQASLLDHQDIETQANIADLYLQLKQFSIAQAYLYVLQKHPIKNSSSYVQKVINTLQINEANK